jgi:hypothetical protein
MSDITLQKKNRYRVYKIPVEGQIYFYKSKTGPGFTKFLVQVNPGDPGAAARHRPGLQEICGRTQGDPQTISSPRGADSSQGTLTHSPLIKE